MPEDVVPSNTGRPPPEETLAESSVGELVSQLSEQSSRLVREQARTPGTEAGAAKKSTTKKGFVSNRSGR
jgi:hypothetical protein